MHYLIRESQCKYPCVIEECSYESWGRREASGHSLYLGIALSEDAGAVHLHDVVSTHQEDTKEKDEFEHFLSVVMAVLKIIFAGLSLESLIVIVVLLAKDLLAPAR